MVKRPLCAATKCGTRRNKKTLGGAGMSCVQKMISTKVLFTRSQEVR